VRPVLNLIIKTLVIPFYRNHAGLLLFGFFVMFGLVEASQIINFHLSLVYGLLESGIFLLVVLVLWLLYNLKTLHFLLKTVNSSSYQFLNTLSLLSSNHSFALFLIISFLTFLPVLVYTFFIYAVALHHKTYSHAVVIFIFQLTLWCLNAFIINQTVRKRHLTQAITLPSFTLPIFKNQLGFYATYLFSEERVAIFISKLFSFGLLYIIKESLESGDDFRIIAIAWLFVLLAHTFLIRKVKVFEDQFLQWIKNLPISRSQEFTLYLKLYGILLLPELIFVSTAIGNGVSIYQFPELILFGSGFLTFIHCHLFKVNLNPDRFTGFLFWLFIVCFMLILSKLIWATAIALMAVAFVQFRIRYFRYERSLE
jgi:hypothetical protein